MRRSVPSTPISAILADAADMRSGQPPTTIGTFEDSPDNQNSHLHLFWSSIWPENSVEVNAEDNDPI